MFYFEKIKDFLILNKQVLYRQTKNFFHGVSSSAFKRDGHCGMPSRLKITKTRN